MRTFVQFDDSGARFRTRAFAMALTSERFELGPRIGRGTSGVVYRAVDRHTGELVAVKLVDLEEAEDEVEDIQREIATLAQIDSEYVTKYLGSWLHEGSMRLAIAMEYMAGGSVADLVDLEPLGQEACAVVCRDLLMALDYLHGEGKIHRDVKAANVLLSATGQVRLADFGVAGQMTHTLGGNKRKTFTGTPFWMAPEVIQSDEQGGYDERCDVWSLGITAIEMATGAPPYSDLHPMRVLFFIPKNPPPRLEGDFDDAFKAFVALCLQKESARRPRARDLLRDAAFVVDAPETSPELARRVAERIREETDASARTDASSDAGGRPEDRAAFDDPAWDFGDGTSSTTSSPVHRYTADGTYTVCLTIDNSWNTDQYCEDVTVTKTGVEETIAPFAVQIYPNPNKGSFVIDLQEKGNWEMSVRNTLGVEISSRTLIGSGPVPLVIEEDGLYFVMLSLNGRSEIHKLLIQR